MSLFKNKTQRGKTYIHECICGGHILRLTKDDDAVHPQHSLEFYGYYIKYDFISRLKLIWRILRKKEYLDLDIYITPDQAKDLGNAILELAPKSTNEAEKATSEYSMHLKATDLTREAYEGFLAVLRQTRTDVVYEAVSGNYIFKVPADFRVVETK